MTASPDFILGLSCFGLITLAYLLHELIEVLKEYVSVLKEILEDD